MTEHDLAPDAPSIAELADRARSLQPVLRERARATEQNRRVSPETIQLLADAELFKAMKPRRFGGFEHGPSVVVRIGYELGQACGGSAWCATLSASNAWFASYWSLATLNDIWGERPDNLVAGTAVPTGRCARVDGGYEVSGQWPWASNCENTDWCFVSAMLPQRDDTPQGVGWFMLPTACLTVDQSSWHVSGMQGSGSKTLIAPQPVFVPDHRVLRFDDIQGGTSPGAAIPGNVQARYSFSTFGAACLVGPLLGMAQGALDCFTDTMKAKVRVAMRPGAPVSAASSPFTQERAGKASAAIDAAMVLVLDGLTSAEAKVRRGDSLDIAERIRIRRNFGFAAQQAVMAVNILFEGAGASSADLDNPLQRFWRDVNAGARHVSLDGQAINSMVGQHLFGLPPIGGY